VNAQPQSANYDLPKEWTTPLQEGDTIPDVTFQTRTRTANDGDFDWKTLTTSDYFDNKRVVLFALPGAFTPTCTTSHLPEYQQAYDEIRQLGIHDVYCLSVNDAFVMRQWGLSLDLPEDTTAGSLGFTKVKLIPDGTAAFTRGMGMSCHWNSERGFGERSWRYSAVIDNGKIEKLFIEQPRIQNSGPDPYEVSGPETMIDYLKSVKESKDEL